MRRLLRKFIPTLTLLASCVWLWSCQQPTATVSDLSKPLSASPTPKPTPPPTIDPRRTDLNRVVVGTYAPDFSLEDMNRKMVHLADFRGKQYVILVFYRGWF
jgi:hypothetical protein